MTSFHPKEASIALSVTAIQGGRSGIATYVFGLLDGIQSMRPDLKIHVFGLEGDQPLFSRWMKSIHWHSVPEHCRWAVWDILWHQVVFPRKLKKLKISCIHIPTYRRILAFPPCRQVVTIHDLAAFRLKKKYDPLRMFYGKFIVPTLARRADQIIAVSQATAKDIETFCSIPKSKIQVVYNGIDHDHFFPQDREKSLLEAPYFVYVARLEHPAKNHLRLIEAFEHFIDRLGKESPYHLFLGGADWHGAETIHQRIESSRYRERIRCLGFVRSEDLPNLYRDAIALVFPSLFEGFGLPPIEAMACGCPVISSHAGSLKEVVDDSAWPIDPNDTESITRALERAISRPNELNDLRGRGLKRAQLFSWNRCAESVLKNY